MSGSVRPLPREETSLSPCLTRLLRALARGAVFQGAVFQGAVFQGAVFPAVLAATAGCSIDDRNVQGSGSDPGATDSSDGGERAGSSTDGSSAAPNGAGAELEAPSFADTGSAGNAGLPGAAGNAGLPGAGGAGADLGGPCSARAQRCQLGTLFVCNEGGMWASLGTTCGECVPDTSECSGSSLRVCSSAGVWIDRLQCAGSQPVCQAATGSCVCNESSCPLGQICSSETFSCVQQVSDCPVPSPIAVSDDIDHGFVSVRFDAATGSAQVRIQNIGTGTVFFDGVVCNGADNCVLLRDGVTIQLNARDTLDVTIPDTRLEGGELALLDASPDEAITGFAYVAWGSGPASNQLETLANTFWDNWRPGERISIAPGDTGFVSTGNNNVAAGYTSCNPVLVTP